MNAVHRILQNAGSGIDVPDGVAPLRDLRLRAARDIPEDDRELSTSARFGPATFHRYEWEVAYSTAEYLDLT